MDNDMYLLENTYLMRRRLKRNRPKRKCWINSILNKRKRLGEFNHLHEELKRNSEKIFDYYRMDIGTFQYILEAIESSIIKWSNFRETIAPKERLALTLRYLATGSSFKTLGYTFRISDVTVGRIVKETCEAIWDNLHQLHMPFPNENEVKLIRQRFWKKWKFPNCVGCIDGKHIRIKNQKNSGSVYRNYKQFFSIVLQAVAGPDYRFLYIHVGAYGKESDGGIFPKFPNCVGCIDGKHIRIKNPKNSGSMYRNYKQFFSIVLQAVSGPDYRFLYIHVGAYGKESDGGIFSHSDLSKELERGALCVGQLSALPETDVKVPNVILGDEAYPLKTFLMRPFPVSKLGPSETVFNKRLSRARQVIECAFGIMCHKWRLLLTTIEIEKPDDIDKIIKCICLLHNIVIKKEGEEPVVSFSCQQTPSTSSYSSIGENRSVNAAYAIREKFKDFCCTIEDNE